MTISLGGALVLLMAAVVSVALWAAHWRRESRRLLDPATRTDRPGVAAAMSVAVLAVVVGALALTAFMPVRASATRSGPVVIEVDASPVSASTSFAAAEMEITLSAAGAVTMTVPTAVSVAATQSLPGVAIDGWTTSPTSPGVFVAEEAENSFAIAGRFTTLDLRFSTIEESTSITLDVGDAREIVMLDSEAAERVVRIRSGTEREVASESFMWSGSDLRFSQPMSALEWSTIAMLPVDAEPVLDAAGDVVGARVGMLEVARALGASAGGVLVLGAVALLLLAVGFVVATACGPALDASGGLSRLRFAIYGLALSMLVIGAANYVVPVRLAVWLLLPVLAVGLVRLGLRARSEPPPRVVVERPAEGLTGPIVAGVVVAAIHGFWFAMSGRWSLGFLQTDVFDTFNVTGLFWHRSALDASIAFGDGFRLLDYTARAAVWGTMLDRPSDAIVVFRLLHGVVVAMLAAGLVARQGYRAWVQVPVGILVSGAAAFVGLYAEGYMSREFFVSWLLVGLLMIGHQLLDADRRSNGWWRVGVVAGVSLAIVPPYFLIAPVLVLAVILSSTGSGWRSKLSSWRPAATGFVASLVIFGLPNVFWLRSSSDANQYIDALNSLVRNLGVPFYDSLRFPAAMLGLVPFHHQDGYRLGGTTIRFGPLSWSTDWLSHAVVVTGFIIIATVLFALSVWVLIRERASTADRGFAAMWIAVVALYVGGFLVLRATRWNEQTYFTIMWIWTLAPVGLTGLVITCLEAGRLRPRLRAAMLAGVLLLAGVNVVSAAGESILWVESPYSELADDWHYDLAAPIDRFDRTLRRGGVDLQGVDFAVVIDRPSSLTGTDDDRVLTNVLSNLLEADGRRCPDCQRNPDFYWITASATAPADIPIVLVGSTDCRTRPELYADEFFAVCGAERP